MRRLGQHAARHEEADVVAGLLVVAACSQPLPEGDGVELTGDQGPREAVGRVMQSGGSPREERRPEAAEEAPPQVVAATEEQSRDNSAGSLPLHKWVQTATPDDESAAAD